MFQNVYVMLTFPNLIIFNTDRNGWNKEPRWSYKSAECILLPKLRDVLVPSFFFHVCHRMNQMLPDLYGMHPVVYQYL
jgi:hypothetical protein